MSTPTPRKRRAPLALALVSNKRFRPTGSTNLFATHQPNVSYQVESADGRRVVEQKQVAERISEPPEELAPFDAHDPDLLQLPAECAPALDDIETVSDTAPKRYLNSDNPMSTYVLHLSSFLEELVALEGRGMSAGQPLCLDCHTGNAHGSRARATHRCLDCFAGAMLCQACMIERHTLLLLHRIEEWRGTHFERVSLMSLGLRLQLGHLPGAACLFPEKPAKDFVVIDTSGIHTVAIDFCGCQEIPRHVQLLRARLWPATTLQPQTAATLEVLDFFNILNPQGKTNAHDFWHTLVQKTDATGLTLVPDRIDSFRLMARQYLHAQMCKRAGQAHQHGNAGNTTAGALCVRCPVCPREGVNLPSAQDRDKERPWLYRPMFMGDANYRLKSKIHSNDTRDTSLTGDASYFVKSKPYHDWVLANATQDDISSCSSFAALANVNTRRTNGLRATGVAAVTCRHDLWLPNGIADLQKGERYCSMDFVFFSVAEHHAAQKTLLSYDIACQYSRHLDSRLDKLAEFLQVERRATSFDFAIPKFHFAAHQTKVLTDGADDHSHYSFNFIEGVGRTDGEGIERCWSGLNGAANSTREMGPGARQDSLSNHCGYVNWSKVAGLGVLLRRRLVCALAEGIKQMHAFREFNTILDSRHPGTRQEWEAMALEWEEDYSKPSPFSTVRKNITLASVRLKLAQNALTSTAVPSSAVAGISDLFVDALDIEELGRRLSLHVVSRQTDSDTHAADILERRASLHGRIERFIARELVLFPARSNMSLDMSEADVSIAAPEAYSLPFPSLYNNTTRAQAYPQEAIDAEAELRFAELHESLDSIRDHLRMRTVVSHDKAHNITGQGPNTRIRALQNQIEDKLEAQVARYRHARSRYQTLVGDGTWTQTFRVLNSADVRGLSESVQRQQDNLEHTRDISRLFRTNAVTMPGEGKRSMSWIWYDAVDLGEGSTNDVIRIEWAKARARAARWEEEVRLLKEEMRRVLATFQYEAAHWHTLAEQPFSVSPDTREGLVAYASKQSCMRLGLYEKFTALWSSPIDEASRMLSAIDLHSLPEISTSVTNCVRLPESRAIEMEYGLGGAFLHDAEDHDI